MPLTGNLMPRNMDEDLLGGGTINGNVTINGNLTINGNFNFGQASVENLFLGDDDYIGFGNVVATPDCKMGWNTTQTADAFVFGVATGQNNFILAEAGDWAYDFAHAAQTNPTLWIQSATQSATQWMSFSHNQTDGIINVGTGVVGFANNVMVRATGTASAPGHEYDSYYLSLKGSAWETTGSTEDAWEFRIINNVAAGATSSGTFQISSYKDNVAVATPMQMNAVGTVTFGGNINSTLGVFTTGGSVPAILRGNDATDGSGVGVVVDNLVTFTTAGDKLLSIRNNTAERAYFSFLGGLYITQAASTAGVANQALTITDGAHTGITAATERIGAYFNMSSTKTWAAGAGPLAVQREIVVTAPTYVGDAGGALTMTTAATLAIAAAPIAGANMTITTPLSLFVQDGAIRQNHTISSSTIAGMTLNYSSSGVTPIVVGLSVTLGAGATSNNVTNAMSFDNLVTGTGNTWSTDTTYGLRPAGNRGAGGYARGTTIGINSGLLALAKGGNVNLGAVSTATVSKASATNIGVVGLGFNDDATAPIQIGGYFSLVNATPTFGTSAALVADNVTTTSDIFSARDNGTAVFTVANGGLITQNPVTTGVLYDFALETEWASGAIINADFGGATTQTGDMIGISLDFNANLAGVTDKDVTGMILKTPALTQSAANTTTYIGWNLATAGALVQDTAAGTITWKGVSVQMPNITQTTGTVNSTGLYINGGTVTSGTQLAIHVDSGNSRFDGLILGGQGTDLASANDMAAPNANYCDVTGDTQINTMAATNLTAGTFIVLQFDSNPLVKHATAGAGAQFQLQGAGDFATSAGDTLTVVYDGTYFREITRSAI
jgi:hypothetical protein